MSESKNDIEKTNALIKNDDILSGSSRDTTNNVVPTNERDALLNQTDNSTAYSLIKKSNNQEVEIHQVKNDNILSGSSRDTTNNANNSDSVVLENERDPLLNHTNNSTADSLIKKSNNQEVEIHEVKNDNILSGSSCDTTNNANNSDSVVLENERDPLLNHTNNSTADSRRPFGGISAYRYQWQFPFIFLFFYIGFGIAFLMIDGGLKNTISTKEVTFLDVLYFVMVTLSSVGYGDIVPNSTIAKIWICFYILVGFGLVCILSNLVAHCSGKLEAILVRNKDDFRLKWMLKPWMLDAKKSELSKRAKVYFSVVVIVLLIAIGTLIAYFTEKLSWMESFYLSICSITTVGYGDYSFQTVAGKLVGGVWILASSVIVARAFSFVSEYDFQRRSDDDILNEITKEELAEEGLGGVVSEYEFAKYVLLKKMRKITETEIKAISKQFNSMFKDANGN